MHLVVCVVFCVGSVLFTQEASFRRAMEAEYPGVLQQCEGADSDAAELGEVDDAHKQATARARDAAAYGSWVRSQWHEAHLAAELTRRAVQAFHGVGMCEAPAAPAAVPPPPAGSAAQAEPGAAGVQNAQAAPATGQHTSPLGKAAYLPLSSLVPVGLVLAAEGVGVTHTLSTFSSLTTPRAHADGNVSPVCSSPVCAVHTGATQSNTQVCIRSLMHNPQACFRLYVRSCHAGEWRANPPP